MLGSNGTGLRTHKHHVLACVSLCEPLAVDSNDHKASREERIIQLKGSDIGILRVSHAGLGGGTAGRRVDASNAEGRSFGPAAD